MTKGKQECGLAPLPMKAVRFQESLYRVENVQEKRSAGKRERTHRPDGHERILSATDVEGRMRVTEQLVQFKRFVGGTDKLPERLELLSEAETETEEEYPDLSQNFRVQTRKALAYEKPTQPVLSSRPGGINEH